MSGALTTKILKLLEDPKNREIVNAGQKIFEVYTSTDFRGEINYIKFNTVGIYITELFLKYTTDLNNDVQGLAFVTCLNCIKLLPEFQKENPKKIESVSITSLTSSNNLMYDQIFAKIGDSNFRKYTLSNFIMKELRDVYQPEIISEAILKSGAMTVAELNQEYEKLNIE
jgi:hypothetical protein